MVLYTNMDELSEHLTHVRCSSYTFPLSLYTGSESSWYGQLSCFFFFFFYHGYIVGGDCPAGYGTRSPSPQEEKTRRQTRQRWVNIALSSLSLPVGLCKGFWWITKKRKRALVKRLLLYFHIFLSTFVFHFAFFFFLDSDTEAGQITLAMSLSLNISLQATSSGTDPNTNWSSLMNVLTKTERAFFYER